MSFHYYIRKNKPEKSQILNFPMRLLEPLVFVRTGAGAGAGAEQNDSSGSQKILKKVENIYFLCVDK